MQNGVKGKGTADEVVGHLMIDPNLDSYGSLQDPQWAGRITAAAKGTPAEQVVLDLCAGWKAAMNTHVLPGLTIRILKSYHDGFATEPEPVAQNMASLILHRYREEHNEDVPPHISKRLRNLLIELQVSAKAIRKRKFDTFDAQEVWRSFVNLPEFQFSIWGSQRLVYAAVYHAYEHFLVGSYMVATGRQKYRLRDGRSDAELAQEFGQEICQACWLDQRIQNARIVRHALAHAGGRVTDEVRTQANGHGIAIVDKQLHPMPKDTKALLNVLKPAALKLTRHLVAVKAAGKAATASDNRT